MSIYGAISNTSEVMRQSIEQGKLDLQIRQLETQIEVQKIMNTHIKKHHPQDNTANMDFVDVKPEDIHTNIWLSDLGVRLNYSPVNQIEAEPIIADIKEVE